jgi:death-on-curing protein
LKQTLYPTIEEALFLHELLIERFGGQPGVRDRGLLQSALGRPRTGYYGTLSLQAGALLQSLARNHAFIDGNKRMAVALCAVFLRMNGYRLVVEPDDGEAFLVQEVIEDHLDLDAIAEWLERHMVKVQ